MSKNNKIEDLELSLLRNAVDNAEKNLGAQQINNPIIKNIIKIVEKFIKDKKLICYGGTAINNILPKNDQFYDKNYQFPDYDFFSKDAIKHAKELADIYYENGYTDVEAKAGLHIGTYKIYVNFIPVADITFLDKKLFNNLFKECIKINDIHYAPPNFLRMNTYLELSRPGGDITRWEKVLKRLHLLNKNYPINVDNCILDTNDDDVIKNHKKISNIILNESSKNNDIFFGGFAFDNFNNFVSVNEKKKIKIKKTFDIITKNAKLLSNKINEKLIENKFNSKIIKHYGIEEIIPDHYEITVDGIPIVYYYESLACYSYNKIKIKNKHFNIATIETMLSFYLSFLYLNNFKYDTNRILCIANFLIKIHSRNKFKNDGILKRFPMKCIGKQKTLQKIRSEKSNIFNTLKNKRKSKKFQYYFLRYIPNNKTQKEKNIKNEKPQEPKKPQKPKKRQKTQKTQKSKKNEQNN